MTPIIDASKPQWQFTFSIFIFAGVIGMAKIGYHFGHWLASR